MMEDSIEIRKLQITCPDYDIQRPQDNSGDTVN